VVRSIGWFAQIGTTLLVSFGARWWND